VLLGRISRDNAYFGVRETLLDLYGAALAAAEPGGAVARDLAKRPLLPHRPVRIFALGKAAPAMARAAVDAVRARGLALAGGALVAPEPGASPHPGLRAAVGNHPVPGDASFAAAELVAEVARAVLPHEQVLVVLSGGTSSLTGAPIPRVPRDEFRACWELLLRSGLDIRVMNAARKRFTRWGAGRLAIALPQVPVRVLLVSDVIGDDPATIASGPCTPDGWSAPEVLRALDEAGLLEALPRSIRRLLEAQAGGAAPETPKPGDPAFAQVETHIVANNRRALLGVVARAQALDLPVLAGASDLAGDAREVGTRLAAFLKSGGGGASCFVWGGETTVRLTEGPSGLGGRCQELALAAAEELAGVPGVALLAAGTDGRDGPTDAAGALIDGETWQQVAAAGRDPGVDLQRHDAYRALDAVGALIRPGPTGTNVMDVVIGLRQGWSSSGGM
jgi:glycerate 2-kinase